MLAEVGIAARELAPALSSCVSYFGSALRLDEPEKRRSRALVLAGSGWVTQPSVAPLRAVFQTLALGSLAVGRIRSTTRDSKPR